MTARLLSLGIGLCVLVAALGPRPAGAGITPVEAAMAEKVMGRDDAPVTIIEYSSLGCPHCAQFHRDTLPAIKKAYIDTGKVRLVYRDFPLGNLALAASMLARCTPPSRFFGMLEILFRNQAKWSTSNNPLGELERMGRMGGLSAADVDACLKSRPLSNAIRKVAEDAQRDFGIQSTPTFVIDDKSVPGALTFDELRTIIDRALAGKD